MAALLEDLVTAEDVVNVVILRSVLSPISATHERDDDDNDCPKM